MIAVIQCAGRKRLGAGHMLSAARKPVIFVGNPAAAPADASHVYACPDGPSDAGPSWRHQLVRYNEEHANDNPLGLYSARWLYNNKAYQRLVGHLGERKVYILSAGWGLIRADFLTPYYDITFAVKKKEDAYKLRAEEDRYSDFQLPPHLTDEEILFFGGKNYRPLFCALTRAVTAKRTVFYNSAVPPPADGCTLRPFLTTGKTNWHYKCVKAFVEHGIEGMR